MYLKVSARGGNRTVGIMSVAGLLLCLVSLAGCMTDATLQNKFYARFYPTSLDPQHKQGYYVMPRTTIEAKADGWAAVPGSRADNTILWVRNGDHRVGLLFDKLNSVAGIQVSASSADLKKSGIPLNYANSDYWLEQTVLGVKVYSAVAYFVDPSVLKKGGRRMGNDTPTAPSFQLLRKGKLPPVLVPKTENDMLKKKWIKQGCYPGQGYHLYQDLTSKSSCAALKPFFFITSPTTKEFTSFGFSIWGSNKLVDSTSRPWFENQKPEYLKEVVFNKPTCFDTWINTYGLWVLHVFFEENPWNVKCT